MKKQYAIFLTLLSICCVAQKGTKSAVSDKDAFVSSLMAKMTLEEKLGQLNLPTSGDITTGQANSSDVAKKIEQGKVGGLFNIKTVSKIKEVQKILIIIIISKLNK